MRRLWIASSLAAALLVPGIRAVSADQQRPAPTVEYRVKSGDTLWRIASRVDPDEDRRKVVYRLMELNELSSATLSPGQSILLPAR